MSSNQDTRTDPDLEGSNQSDGMMIHQSSLDDCSNDNPNDDTCQPMMINDQNDGAGDGDEDIVLENESDIQKLSLRQLQNVSRRMFQQLSDLKRQCDRQSHANQKELNNLQNQYEQKLKQTCLEASRKENILIMRLTLKEQELQDCLTQIRKLDLFKSPYNSSRPELLLQDPGLNYIFQKMNKEVENAKLRVEEMQKEMNAWKFSHDSITGKQLMAKCRQLYQENEELGKMISSGKIAKLESGLAMYKNYSESLNKSQEDFEETLNEIEENGEGLQNTIYYLNSKCQEFKDKIQRLEQLVQRCQCEIKHESHQQANNAPAIASDERQPQQQPITRA